MSADWKGRERMLKSAVSGALCLIVAGAAGAQTHRSDADILSAEVLPALELAADPTFAAIVQSYADCFATAVAKSPASSLKDDQTVQSAQSLADTACRSSKKVVTKEADAALSVRSPSLSADARAHLLGGVRRQATLFALIAAYRQAGKRPILQRYLERIGRQSRAGQSVVALSGE